MKPRTTPKGFTLIELILGSLITAIIGLCIYNMFWSAMKLDDKMRHVHDNYMEVLMADQALSHDLENALTIDLSGSYPNAAIFDGQKTELSFLTQTPDGIKHVRYYSGIPGQDDVSRMMIGRVTNPSAKTQGALPVEFLLRQESSLKDWLNETNTATSIQIVAAGLKEGSFSCQYAPYVKDLHTDGAKGIVYSDTWDDKGLPMAVSCDYTLYDPKNPEEGLKFKRDIFLAPVVAYYAQQ